MGTLWPWLASARGFRYLKKLTIWENDLKLEETTLPKGLIFAWDTALPHLEVEHTLCIALWLSIETEWVIAAPLLPRICC